MRATNSALLALLVGLAACDGAETGPRNVAGPGGMTPDAPGSGLALEAIPDRWTLGEPAFPIRIRYRNAPAGAGVILSIRRDLPMQELHALPASGGALNDPPVPVEGDGTVEVRFEGRAWSAPADAPRSFPLQPGPHVIEAEMVNHRDAVVAMMIRNPAHRILARSAEVRISIQAPD